MLFKCASHFLHKKLYSPFQDWSKAKRSGYFEFKVLLLLSSAFFKKLIFSVPGHPTSCTCRTGNLESRIDNFALIKILSMTTQATEFLWVPLRSKFRRLMLDTSLWQHIKMTTILKSPKGLKDSECKKGQLSSQPPVLYVLPTDLVKNPPPPPPPAGFS